MTLYNRCINILLSNNKKNSYYIESINNSLKKISQDKKLEKENEHVNLYINLLEKFYQSEYVDAKIEAFEQKIVENYFHLLDILCDYILLEYHSLNYISEYRIFAIRTMELAIFLQNKKLQVNELFFDKKEKYFYESLIKIYHIGFNKEPVTIIRNNKNEFLDENIKIHSDGIFVGNNGEYSYISNVKKGAGYTKEIALYKYLRLLQRDVYNVFMQLTLRKKEGGGGGQHIDLIGLEPYPNKINYANKIVDKKIEGATQYDRYDSQYDNDEELESISKSRKQILNSKGVFYSLKDSEYIYNNYVDDDKYKLNIKSSDERSGYKKHQLNKAIGHLQAKSNLNLSSTYTVPKLELLSTFLDALDRNTIEYKLLITSILLGVEPKTVIAMKLKLTTELQFVHKKYMRVKLTTAYANIKDFEIYQETNKTVEYLIPSMLVEYLEDILKELFEPLKEMILSNKTIIGTDVTNKFSECKNVRQLHNFMVEEMDNAKIKDVYNSFIDKQNNNLVKYLKIKRDKFPKTIVLHIRNLHLFTFYFFNNIYKESNINLLFLKNKTANIHTVLAYVASRTNIYRMTEWIEEFSMLLNIQLQKGPLVLESEYSGSNKLIKTQQFKMFLTILMKIKSNDKYFLASIKMIYLRYVFSILLGTRKFHFSCNLKQYSKRENLLLIHEKAKNIYTSKRMIPLTKLGYRYIKYFYKLRDELNFDSYMPILFDKSGNSYDFNNKNLLKWLEENKDELLKSCTQEDYKFIKVFILSVVLDFGRHIFASKAHNNMEIFQEYTDAFLNHYSNGTQDQGIYSMFDNKEYMSQIRLLMNEIEKEYILFWKEIL